MSAPAPDNHAAAGPSAAAQSDPASAAESSESSRPLTAEMLQADPRITHDVIELTEPWDPTDTFEA